MRDVAYARERLLLFLTCKLSQMTDCESEVHVCDELTMHTN
jgi:hypothetical protein